MLVYVASGLLVALAITFFVVLARRATSWGHTDGARPEGYRHQGPFPPAGGGGV